MATGRKPQKIPAVTKASHAPPPLVVAGDAYCGLTPPLLETIAAAVRAGTTPVRAAACCGITYAAWQSWRAHALAGREPYRTRFALIQAAEAQFLGECEARIRAAAQGGEWKADAWLLERRDRNTYSTRLEVTARPAEVDPAELSDADLARIASGGTLGGPDSPPGGDSN